MIVPERDSFSASLRLCGRFAGRTQSVLWKASSKSAIGARKSLEKQLRRVPFSVSSHHRVRFTRTETCLRAPHKKTTTLVARQTTARRTKAIKSRFHLLGQPTPPSEASKKQPSDPQLKPSTPRLQKILDSLRRAHSSSPANKKRLKEGLTPHFLSILKQWIQDPSAPAICCPFMQPTPGCFP